MTTKDSSGQKIAVRIKLQTALVSKYFPFRQLTFNHSGSKILKTDKYSNLNQSQNKYSPDKYGHSSSLLLCLSKWNKWHTECRKITAFTSCSEAAADTCICTNRLLFGKL